MVKKELLNRRVEDDRINRELGKKALRIAEELNNKL